ncbi:M3 family oligoendopeptidase [Govanella unica]|uniref:M3 family oligoendopeptidase n=1 Tax=Govanella unica TaxID=2975056 RepID=A0A9X3U1K5_9PROT|nr:M3 family oligoendopeptidase [Govania unica]MDA5194874.1 M3 family oligoendopeptidase [Govania unica]
MTATAPSLPTWDLSDLYPGPDSPELAADLATSETEAQDFAARYAGKLATLSGDELAAAVATFERIQERFGRLLSYAGLLRAGDLLDADIGRFAQSVQEKISDISRVLIFFSLELNNLEDGAFEAALAQSAALAHYGPWLLEVRKYKPHQLAAELEGILHDKQVTGASSWVRLYDETLATLSFTIPDPASGTSETLTMEEALDRLFAPEEARRKAAAEALSATFRDNIRLFTLVTNTLAKDKEIEDRWRKFPSPEASRHLANQVEPEVVAALVAAVREAYPSLSHRFYRLKAKWMGKDKLDHWDRNAPLETGEDSAISWDEAKVIVLDAYRAFSPELADVGQRFFDKPWIDVPPRPGKATGAFAHPTVPAVHPYLLLNYMGKTRDVMTLAHELGHGVHQVLAADQGLFLSDTPLTLAETASVFGEMLTFKAMLAATTDRAKRRHLLMSKVQDMLNTVVRQIAFYTFEQKIHAARANGELTAEDIGKIWLEVQSESLGDAIRLNDGYDVYWCYISHFIHSPFYVYAYAFGDCLVNSLYATYEAEPEGFAAKYMELLAAGGSKGHKELLAPFGLDAADPAFWRRGLATLASFIDELEENS